MTAPDSGVKVRMYRQGHGDCFLLAFAGADGEARYVLIDCGYKPGSTVRKTIKEVTDHIRASTGGVIDLMIVTHEHQDHLNGITETSFAGIGIKRAWFAWTENPQDDLANDLRRRHRDQLLGLLGLRNRLAAAGSEASAALGRIDDLLSLEAGGDSPELDPIGLAAAAKDPAKSFNKQAMKLIKVKAGTNVRYISPHEEIMDLPDVPGVRVFALGPPRDPDMLKDEDPVGAEAFPGNGAAFAAASSLYAAAARDPSLPVDLSNQPFRSDFAIPLSQAFVDEEFGSFFRDHYGQPDSVPVERSSERLEDDAPVRRIDKDWLYSGEELALQLNKGINNTSLVLAIELPKTRKVLLFVGDAQRGNWRSWTRKHWTDGDKTITTRDLLARTVLYKVGHHASHNATLKGTLADDYANLGWMAQGAAGADFTAMITAVPRWAYAQRPVWAHPQAAIKAELVKRTGGRVFQTDTDEPQKPDSVTDAEWAAFKSRVEITEMYFDYEIPDA